MDGINSFLASIEIKRNDYDIIHPTYYDPYLMRKGKGRKVVTIHDMIQELFPEYYAGEKTIREKKESIFLSDHIIAISENTKKDILKIYSEIKPEKISVIYHGSSKLNPAGKKPGIKLPDEYVLFVGNRYTYKNFKRFFEAMCPIMDKSNIHIVCGGGGKFTKEEEIYLERYSERVHQFSMSDADLQKAYKNAICFVFPSLYEGFGLPVLEAFECDCPVVISNTSSLPEVGRDAACYFDPKDIEAIRDAIQKVTDNRDEFRSPEMSEKRRNIIRELTWKRSAEKLKQCYEKII